MNDSTYTVQTWDRYADAHAAIMTSFQWSMFQEAALALSGDVLDCGCGTARIAPLLADRRDVHSYTGVDLAPAMVGRAQRLIATLDRQDFTVRQCPIEEVTGRFSSAVSIHSYYSWPDPAAVLARIHQVLVGGGRFVLVTPNERLDMERLLREAAKELAGHPLFDDFRRMNLALAAAPGARFVRMDELVGETRAVGFQVLECHQRHYLEGVNFLVLAKAG